MHMFEVTGGGTHLEKGSKRAYVKGDVFQSPNDLVSMFPGKFRRLSSDEIEMRDKKAPGASPQPVVTIGSSSKEKKGEKSEDARGDDVSDEFKDLPKGLLVFRRGEYFHLFQAKKSKPLNDKGLKTDKEVWELVKKYMED